jgi:hypothetical protein
VIVIDRRFMAINIGLYINVSVGGTATLGSIIATVNTTRLDTRLVG